VTPELVFLHIPKTAGTSQQRAFLQYHGSENVFWIGYDCPPGVRRYPAGLVGDSLLVGGHKPLSFYPGHFDPLYCAVLRDPVERAISLYVYYTQPQLASSAEERETRREILQRLQEKGMDPGSMLNSLRNCRSFRREVSNQQCAYISGSRDNFDGALRSLRQHDFLLGTIEDYSRFYARLVELLAWPDNEPAILNRSKDNYAGTYLEDEALVALLRELNTQDQKLLDFVNREHAGLYERQRDPQARLRRLQGLPLLPWISRNGREDWKQLAARFWPAKSEGSLAWPRDRILVEETSKLMYMPIPGPANACPQVAMLEHSSVAHPRAVLALGLGRVLARFATGLMLADRNRAEIDAILQDDTYFRFAILNDPVARLVDVYVDRFVLNRSELPDSPRLAALVAWVQGKAAPDVDEGISFREFVTAVLGQKTHRQHWLWKPQYLYLQGLPGYDKLYRQDQLHILESDLMRLRGVPVTIPKSAPLPGSAPAGAGTVSSGRYADCRCAALPAEPARWRDQLVDSTLCQAILTGYSRDCELYNRTAENEIQGVES